MSVNLFQFISPNDDNNDNNNTVIIMKVIVVPLLKTVATVS